MMGGSFEIIHVRSRMMVSDSGPPLDHDGGIIIVDILARIGKLSDQAGRGQPL